MAHLLQWLYTLQTKLYRQSSLALRYWNYLCRPSTTSKYPIPKGEISIHSPIRVYLIAHLSQKIKHGSVSHCCCVFTMVLYNKNKSISHEYHRKYTIYIIALWPQNMIWPLIGRYQTTHNYYVQVHILTSILRNMYGSSTLSYIIVTRDTNCGLRTDGRTNGRTDGRMDKHTGANYILCIHH